ncbi:MAG: U32 family peptidase [Nanobdellota archaeon]
MKKPELVAPAGDELSLRAAVANGADAVYFGLAKFNARRMADNFRNPKTIVNYCHKHNVKAYLALNTLIKNNELDDFFYNAILADKAGVDAIIIQDPFFIPLLKKYCKCRIHMSTQAKIMNASSIPAGAQRVVLPRELSLREIKTMSKATETEVFCHGAICVSYSGMCLFSSFAGQRSANRGLCAQPCRKRYNSKYLLSTKELCLTDKIGDLIRLGVASFKIEGRLRSYKYVGVATRTYRKLIDDFFAGKANSGLTEQEKDNLEMVFNRGFTKGFAYDNKIVGNINPTNRGLFIGMIKDNKLKLEKWVFKNDGIALWNDENRTGMTLKNIKPVLERGSLINFEGEKDGTLVYKTSSAKLDLKLAEKPEKPSFIQDINPPRISFDASSPKDSFKLLVKVNSYKGAKDAFKAGADVIYSPLDGFYKKEGSNSRFFVQTPDFADDEKISSVVKLIRKINPDGVLVSNPGFIKYLSDYELHLDYNFNIFNDLDVEKSLGLPVVSPELSLKELKDFKNKNFAVFIHGNIQLMKSKAKIDADYLVDDSKRKFPVIHIDMTRIFNCNDLGLFNDTKKLFAEGIRYFFMELEKDYYKYVNIYKRILSGEKINDKRLRKGFTTGHLYRGVK